MIEDWIKRYFSEEQIPEVLDILSGYGTESWHREEDRVKNDYRDVLIGEAIDPLVIGELSKYKT